MRLWLAILILLPGIAGAATITAASTSSTDVQSAHDSASDGDTVRVPSGSATWGAGAVNITKAIWLQGAASYTNGTTTITINGQTGLHLNSWTKYMRVSGFTFIDSFASATSDKGCIATDANYFRICSNIFTSANHPLIVWGTTNTSALIDNNTVDIDGASFVNVYGDDIRAWDYGTTYGTTNYVYIEHNAITSAGIGDGIFDMYGGAKFVFRYNTVTNGYWGWHGCDSTPNDSGQGWSPHSYEIYGNAVYYNNTGYYCIMNSRGGTGLIFSNTVSGRTASGTAIYMQYYRQSQPGASPSWGDMTGSNAWDGNTAGASPSGYPGLCQQGRTGPTTGYAKTGSGTNSTQVLSLTYIWGNDAGYTFGVDASTIAEGRDYTNAALSGYTPLENPHPLAGYSLGGGGGGSSGNRSATVSGTFRAY